MLNTTSTRSPLEVVTDFLATNPTPQEIISESRIYNFPTPDPSPNAPEELVLWEGRLSPFPKRYAFRRGLGKGLRNLFRRDGDNFRDSLKFSESRNDDSNG